MKVLVVEDEPLLARQLIHMVKEFEPTAEIAANTNSIETTVEWLSNNAPPDLILMDIELADGQCFDIFTKTPVKSPVIFTTAYDEYALRAFKVNSIDYLLKPVKEEELEAALNKWKEFAKIPAHHSAPPDFGILINELKKANNGTTYRDRFLVKQGQKMVSLNTNDIAFFFAKNTLNYIITGSGQKFIIDYTLDELETFIDPKLFFRANRQFIISHSIIIAVHPWFNGKLKLDISQPVENEIIVSREKAPFFKEWMGA